MEVVGDRWGVGRLGRMPTRERGWFVTAHVCVVQVLTDHDGHALPAATSGCGLPEATYLLSR
jgi:hypothetical protein